MRRVERRAEHTPGPWVAVEFATNDPEGWAVEQASFEGIPVADTLSWADAHLIAAAPDLLAACEAAEHALRKNGWCDSPGPGPCGPCPHCDALDNLNKIIAKARGKQERDGTGRGAAGAGGGEG